MSLPPNDERARFPLSWAVIASVLILLLSVYPLPSKPLRLQFDVLWTIHHHKADQALLAYRLGRDELFLVSSDNRVRLVSGSNPSATIASSLLGKTRVTSGRIPLWGSTWNSGAFVAMSNGRLIAFREVKSPPLLKRNWEASFPGDQLLALSGRDNHLVLLSRINNGTFALRKLCETTGKVVWSVSLKNTSTTRAFTPSTLSPLPRKTGVFISSPSSTFVRLPSSVVVWFDFESGTQNEVLQEEQVLDVDGDGLEERVEFRNDSSCLSLRSFSPRTNAWSEMFTEGCSEASKVMQSSSIIALSRSSNATSQKSPLFGASALLLPNRSSEFRGYNLLASSLSRLVCVDATSDTVLWKLDASSPILSLRKVFRDQFVVMVQSHVISAVRTNDGSIAAFIHFDSKLRVVSSEQEEGERFELVVVLESGEVSVLRLWERQNEARLPPVALIPVALSLVMLWACVLWAFLDE